MDKNKGSKDTKKSAETNNTSNFNIFAPSPLLQNVSTTNTNLNQQQFNFPLMNFSVKPQERKIKTLAMALSETNDTKANGLSSNKINNNNNNNNNNKNNASNASKRKREEMEIGAINSSNENNFNIFQQNKKRSKSGIFNVPNTKDKNNQQKKKSKNRNNLTISAPTFDIQASLARSITSPLSPSPSSLRSSGSNLFDFNFNSNSPINTNITASNSNSNSTNSNNNKSNNDTDNIFSRNKLTHNPNPAMQSKASSISSRASSPALNVFNANNLLSNTNSSLFGKPKPANLLQSRAKSSSLFSTPTPSSPSSWNNFSALSNSFATNKNSATNKKSINVQYNTFVPSSSTSSSSLFPDFGSIKRRATSPFLSSAPTSNKQSNAKATKPDPNAIIETKLDLTNLPEKPPTTKNIGKFAVQISKIYNNVPEDCLKPGVRVTVARDMSDGTTIYLESESMYRIANLPNNCSEWLSILMDTGKLELAGIFSANKPPQNAINQLPVESMNQPSQKNNVTPKEKADNNSTNVDSSEESQKEKDTNKESEEEEQKKFKIIEPVTLYIHCTLLVDTFRKNNLMELSERRAWMRLYYLLGKRGVLPNNFSHSMPRVASSPQLGISNASQSLGLGGLQSGNRFQPGAAYQHNSFQGNSNPDDLVKRLFNNLQSNKPKAEMEASAALLVKLRSYQKQALNWLVNREAIGGGDTKNTAKSLPPSWTECVTADGKKYYYNAISKTTTWHYPISNSFSTESKAVVRGGILADEMGMGKTIEMLSLILTNSPHINAKMKAKAQGMPFPSITQTTGQNDNKQSTSNISSQPVSNSTLIVCPLSVLEQWQQEITNKSERGIVSIYIYHGQNRVKDPQYLIKHDVVLTTFSTLATELPSDRKKSTKRPPRKDIGALLHVHWLRVILDEAHMIKDRSTRTAKASYKLKAQRRWCVTGTPIQNKLDDLYSLLNFLKVEPYCNYSWWNQVIMKPVRNRDERGFRRLQTVLETILLRRTKETRTINNKPIISLPPRILKIRKDNFMLEESDFYKALWDSAKTKFNKYVEVGTVLHNYAHILELLLRLRQACDHPILVLNSRDTSKMAAITATNIPSWVDKECVICLETLESPVRTKCDHLFCSKCITQEIKENKMKSCPICSRPISLKELVHLETSDTNYNNNNNYNNDNSSNNSNNATSYSKHNKPKQFLTSTKIEALLQELHQLRTFKPTDKSIIFSQWTSMLNIIEIPLAHCGFNFVRLDGSMSQAQRTKAIYEFTNNVNVTVFLISMKAGGLGLNLISASNVFLLDPWWNPATEQQAIDRVHRMGQTKPVIVTRFIIKDSIEERIVELQDKKRKLAKGALALQSKELRQIRLDELRLLFRD